jgi:uncharacterized protein YecT (DUF1311 family)
MMRSWKHYLLSVGLVVLSASGAIVGTNRSVSAAAEPMPNCAKPADDFERSFCEVKPNCAEAMTQLDMNFCSAWSAKLSDRELNRVYQQVQNSYKPTAADSTSTRKYKQQRSTELTTAQLAWIKYRDANCKWDASVFSGGSAEPMRYSGCVNQMTKQRTQELSESLDL